MHVDDPRTNLAPQAVGGRDGGVVAASQAVELDDAPMTEAGEEEEEAGRVPPTPSDYLAWRYTRAADLWDAVITDATADEVAADGVDPARVMVSFFARFVGDRSINIRVPPGVTPEGKSQLPREVRRWLEEAGYRATYGALSSAATSDVDQEDERSDGGEAEGELAGRPQHQQQQQQQRQQQQQSQPHQAVGVGAGPQHGQAPLGRASGVGAQPGGGIQQPPRRGTRERRQAPLASELPGSLAAMTQAPVGASSGAPAYTRPPQPHAGGARRRP
jgi:hypothetical protein